MLGFERIFVDNYFTAILLAVKNMSSLLASLSEEEMKESATADFYQNKQCGFIFVTKKRQTLVENANIFVG